MNFGNLKQFLRFKIIRKTIKSLAQYWAKTGPGLQPTGRVGRHGDVFADSPTMANR
jgi:hypothetical protein